MSSKNEISEYLKELTDTIKFSHEQTMINLKGCLKDKKCCIFSCGANIIEHSDKFEQIKNDKTFITCCIKSSIKYLDFETDILALCGCINGTYLKNDKTQNAFILKTESFAYDGTSYNLDNFKMQNYKTPSYNIINFLNYVGVKEIYLFGFYICDYIINDLTNYNFYDDILCRRCHTYDAEFSRIKEIEIFWDHIESSKSSQYCVDNNILIYNVSEEGCLSNKIKRINFESVFTNKKTFISSKVGYKDFLHEFDNKVDIDFYYERNCNNNNNNNNITLLKKKQEVLTHLIHEGIYCLKKVNKYDTKNEICLNNFIKNIMCLMSYILCYPVTPISHFALICHYLKRFNEIFSVCFYKDIDKISSPIFFDNLILLHRNVMNNIDFNIFYKKYDDKKYNENKYFKMFCYLAYLKNIPADFNSIDYKELNGDLQAMTDLQAKMHYNYFGYKENRKYKYENIPEDFNPTEYKELNQDLKHMTTVEVKTPHSNIGYKENRKYKKIPDDFNPKEYKELNQDLKHMTNLQAKQHYKNFGYKENRKYKKSPDDFNPTEYKELNTDLKYMTDLEAIQHYKNFGYKENRKYKKNPDDFNTKEYKELNEDLNHLTDLEAIQHYKNFGYKENRKYKKKS